MAITYLKAHISNPADPKKTEALDFLVDSGAIYSVVPASVLKKLGIKVEEEREFTLANGQKLARKMGIARFQFQGNKGGASVIFGEKGDSILLGVTSLEAIGMALNPLKRELIPLPMVLG